MTSTGGPNAIVQHRCSHPDGDVVLWFPPQASSAAAYVDDLFALETGIGSFIFFGCTGVMGWVLLFNRAGK